MNNTGIDTWVRETNNYWRNDRIREVSATLARQHMIGWITRLTGEDTQTVWARVRAVAASSTTSLDEAILADYGCALEKANVSQPQRL